MGHPVYLTGFKVGTTYQPVNLFLKSELTGIPCLWILVH